MLRIKRHKSEHTHVRVRTPRALAGTSQGRYARLTMYYL